MNKVILVIAAHPDDEALGCSGTIAKHVSNGDIVHILFMTNGVSSRTSNKENIIARKKYSEDSCQILRITSISYLDFPDNKMDTVPLLEIVQSIEKRINHLAPSIIYTHHIGDLNIDHQFTHKAVMTACRPQPNFCVKEIYAFEVLSSTEWQSTYVQPFLPSVFIDISEHIEEKHRSLNAYAEEMRPPPHSRSIENTLNLAKTRGAIIGVEYAEAFISLRQIK